MSKTVWRITDRAFAESAFSWERLSRSNRQQFRFAEDVQDSILVSISLQTLREVQQSTNVKRTNLNNIYVSSQSAV